MRTVKFAKHKHKKLTGSHMASWNQSNTEINYTACHVTDPSMCYCIYSFIIVLNAPTVTMPLTNKVSSSSSSSSGLMFGFTFPVLSR